MDSSSAPVPGTWLELQYSHSITCSGYPADAAFLFYTADQTSYAQPANETWPTLYTLELLVQSTLMYPNFYCGQYLAPLTTNQQCCTESLDTSIETGTQGMTSGADIVIPSFDLSDAALSSYFLAGSSGASYCYLSSSPPASSSSDELVYGFNSVLIRRDDSLCVNINSIGGSATCSSNGTYMVYSNYSCTGDLVQVETLTSSFSNTSLPGVVGKVLVLGAASLTIGWTQSVPSNYLVPKFVNVFEIFELLAIIGALTASFFNFLYSIRMYVNSKNNKFVVPMFLHLGWLVSTIAFAFYNFEIFYTPLEAGNYTVFEIFTSTLVNLATVLYSIRTFSQILNISKFQSNVISVAMIMVWSVLSAGSFMFAILNYQATPPTDLVKLSLTWDEQCGKYWKIIFFAVILLPNNIIALKLISNGERIKITEIIYRLIVIDDYFFKIDIAQLVLIALYYSLLALTDTEICGSDRAVFAMGGTIELFINVFASFNFAMLSRLHIIVKNLKTDQKLRMVTKRKEGRIKKSSMNNTPLSPSNMNTQES